MAAPLRSLLPLQLFTLLCTSALLPTSLAFAGLLVVAVAAGCGGGGGGGGRPVEPPVTTTDLMVLDGKVAPARLRLVLTNAVSAAVRVRFFHARSAAPGVETPLVGLATNPMTLAASPAGSVHELPWNFRQETSLSPDGSFVDGITVIARVEGGGTLSVTTSLGNDAPVVQPGSAPAAAAGTFGLPFTLRDSSADRVAVKVEFRRENAPGAAWQLARPAGLLPGDATPEFSFPDVEAPAIGAGFVFFWDSAADLPNLDRIVRVRFTPRDAVVAGMSGETGPIRIDNNDEPVVQLDETALLARDDHGNGVPIPFRVLDDESDPVHVVFQWRLASEAGFPPLGNGDPATLVAQMGDPEFVRSRHICTPYPSPVIGPVVPVDATHVRLPQLLLGQHSTALAAGLVGREIELLRTQPAFAPLHAGWATNPLVAPVAAMPSEDGLSAFVLDSLGSGTGSDTGALVELDLVTGVVRRTIAIMNGAPSALAEARTAGHVLVATDQAGLWRLFEVDLRTGAVEQRAQQPAGGAPGPLRGVTGFGSHAALATAGDEVMSIDWVAGAKVTTIRSGLAEPWGIVVDPSRPTRAYVAERLAPGIAVLDLPSRTIAALGGFYQLGLHLSALGISDDGTRLGVLMKAPSPAGSMFLGLLELGTGTQSNLSVPLDSVAVAFGPDRLALLTQGASRGLQARYGNEQRRRVVGFDPATATAAVSPPLMPLPGPRQTWRLRGIDPFAEPVASSPDGVGNVFVWNSADVPGGERVYLQATPIDGEVGLDAATTVDLPIDADLQAPPLQLPVAGPRAIVAADIDHDGDVDLVAASGSTNSLALFEQTSPGTFATAPILIGGSGISNAPQDVMAVDVGGDGAFDLAVATASGLLVFQQVAPNTFAPPQRIDPPGFPAGRQLAAADLDGDGDVDLVSANGAVAAVFFQQAPMVWSAPVLLDFGSVVTAAVATDVDVGDLDGDGDQDIALTHENATPGAGASNGVMVFLQTAPQVFGQPFALPTLLPPAAMRVADVDGDGALELVLTQADAVASELAVFRRGSFSRFDVSLSSLVLQPTAVAIADLDADGRPDLVCADHVANTMVVLHQTAPGAFSAAPLTLGGSGVTDGPKAIVAADLDADGRVDLVCANEAGGTLSVLLCSRGRHFRGAPAPVGGPTTTPQLRGVTVGDFDADGRLDLLATSGVGTPAVSIFTQAIGGGFGGAPLVVQPPFSAPAGSAAGDLDGDGDVDFVTTDGSNGNVALGRQVTQGVFTGGPLIGQASGTVWNTPSAVAVGDLDGDSDNDVAAIEQGAVAIVFQQTAGGFSSPPLRLLASPDPQVAPVLADLDGDGDTDIAVLNATAITVWRQTAAGTFSPPQVLPVPGFDNTARALAAADLDNDSRIDLVTANDGNVTVFRQFAPGVFALALTLPGTGNSSIAALDFDLDGDQDLACVRGGQLVLLRQVAPFTFGEARVLGGAGLSGLSVADIDGDGDVDVVGVEAGAQRSVVFFGGR